MFDACLIGPCTRPCCSPPPPLPAPLQGVPPAAKHNYADEREAPNLAASSGGGHRAHSSNPGPNRQRRTGPKNYDCARRPRRRPAAEEGEGRTALEQPHRSQRGAQGSIERDQQSADQGQEARRLHHQVLVVHAGIGGHQGLRAGKLPDLHHGCMPEIKSSSPYTCTSASR